MENIYPNCGTYTGYIRHIRKKTNPCAMCKDARNEYSNAHRRKTRKPKNLKPCGTYAAYRRHNRNGEIACGPCTEAFREYKRVQYATS